MKKHTIAIAITALLAAGGNTLAGEGVDVQQDDPYAIGNWQAQATGHFDGVDVDQNPGDPGRFAAQPTLPLVGREIRRREVGMRERVARERVMPEFREAPDLCRSRLIRLLFEFREVELDCP